MSEEESESHTHRCDWCDCEGGEHLRKPLRGGISQQPPPPLLFFKQYSCQTGWMNTQQITWRAAICSTVLSHAGLIHYCQWKKCQSNLITNGADYLRDYSDHVWWGKWYFDCERLDAKHNLTHLETTAADKTNEVAA